MDTHGFWIYPTEPWYIEYSRLNQRSINRDQSAEYKYIDLHITSLYCNQIYPTPSGKPYLNYSGPLAIVTLDLDLNLAMIARNVFWAWK